MKKIDALAELAPDKVIEMYAPRFPTMPAGNRPAAIEYLRLYATVYYAPDAVPANISEKINELEAKTWPVAQ